MRMEPRSFQGLETLEQRSLLSASISGVHPLTVKPLATKSPSISVTGDTVADGADLATDTLTFTITRTGTKKLLKKRSVVEYDIVGLTAEDGSDFDESSGKIVFKKGETTKTVDVTVSGDDIYEGTAELIRFKFDKKSVKNATLDNKAAFGTITEDDVAPTVDIADGSVAEGNTGTAALEFDVTLSEAAEVPVTVTYTAASGTATSGTDFAAATGTVTIPAGQTTGTITVNVTGDTLYEVNDETLTVTLTDPTNATLGDDEATGTITEDDVEPTISVGDVEIDEDEGTMTFTITLSNASTEAISVDYAANDDTAEDENGDGDYEDVADGTLNFAAGETTKTVVINITNDTTDEDDETLTLDLSNATNATIVDAQGVGTIVDDDAAPTLSIADVTDTDANTPFGFDITLSAASGKTVTVVVNTADGTATVVDTDYTAVSDQTVTFNPGETTKTVNVTVADDADATDEAFTVVMTSPTNATLADATATGTIQPA